MVSVQQETAMSADVQPMFGHPEIPTSAATLYASNQTSNTAAPLSQTSGENSFSIRRGTVGIPAGPTGSPVAVGPPQPVQQTGLTIEPGQPIQEVGGSVGYVALPGEPEPPYHPTEDYMFVFASQPGKLMYCYNVHFRPTR